jgi:hypothetical protein
MHIPSLLFLLAPLALALPSELVPTDLATRQSCAVTCGSTCYTSAQINAARSAGTGYVKSGSTAGGSTYPHKYNNYEGFDFLVGGTYYEFPLRKAGVYTGGMYSISYLVLVKMGVWGRNAMMSSMGYVLTIRQDPLVPTV